VVRMKGILIASAINIARGIRYTVFNPSSP